MIRAVTRGLTRAEVIAVGCFALLVLVALAFSLHGAVSLDSSPKVAVGGHFIDYRDTVWVPVRDLIHGHDPYDPLPYLARHPHSQEFDLYAPWYLGLAMPFALLPFRIGATAWLLVELLALLAAVVCTLRWLRGPRLDARWRVAALLIAAVWILLPSRFALVVGQPIGLIVLGVALVLTPPSAWSWWPAVGLVLVTTKPQFGLVFILVLVVQRAWSVLGRAALLAFVLGIGPLVSCVVVAGGPGGFVDAVRRNLSYASGPSTSSLYAPDQQRLDLAGAWARIAGVPHGPLAVALAVVPLVVVALAARGRVTSWSVVAICCGSLLALPHQPYDSSILVIAATAGVMTGIRSGHRSLVALGALVLLAVVHPHRFNPLDFGQTLSLDTTVLVVVLVASTVLRRRQGDVIA